MSVRSELLVSIALAKELVGLLNQIEGKQEGIMSKFDEIKDGLEAVKSDIVEIDSDLQGVLDKLNEAATNGLSAEQAGELAEIVADLKTRTRVTADKVPTA